MESLVYLADYLWYWIGSSICIDGKLTVHYIGLNIYVSWILESFPFWKKLAPVLLEVFNTNLEFASWKVHYNKMLLCSCSKDDNWFLLPQQQRRHSIHCDMNYIKQLIPISYLGIYFPLSSGWRRTFCHGHWDQYG